LKHAAVGKEILMPHVNVKMHAGRTEKQKQRLADELCKAVKNAIGSADESISVAVEDIDPRDWTEKVYKPEILARPETLYKKPGY
jgi:4-oxalocrotonate tautomerase